MMAKMKYLPFFSFFLLVLFLQAFAGETRYQIKPVPGWVDQIEITALQLSELQKEHGGTRYILVDDQIHMQKQAYFLHRAREVLNEDGVQDEVKLEFAFDPTYEKLVIHFIRLIRQGEVIDLLNRDELMVLQRESRLDQKIYDGNLSVVMFLKDIRVGDIIEYAVSNIGFNPVFKNKFFINLQFSWTVPVDYIYYRLNCPASRKLNLVYLNSESKPEVTLTDHSRIYKWDVHNSPVVIFDSNTPAGFNPYELIQISEYGSWREVAEWAVKLYRRPPGATSISEFAEKIAAANSDTKARVHEVLRFVQDEVKYLGIEFGENGYKPSKPATTLKRRYGDCKDKTFLLCAILDELDIKANPVLVNSQYKDKIAFWAPSPYAFDHVITRVQVGKEIFWLDPTESLQGGGLSEMSISGPHTGLIIDENTSALVFIPETLSETVGVSSTETYQVADFTSPVLMNISTKYQGENANRVRSYFSSNSINQIQKDYFEYASRYFPGLLISDSIKYQDDREQNIINITEGYSIPDFWQYEDDSSRINVDIYPMTIVSFIPYPDSPQRSMPYALDHPTRVENQVRVYLPEDWTIPKKKGKIENSSFEFEYNHFLDTFYKEGRKMYVLNMDYSFGTKLDQAEATLFKDFYRKIEEIDDLLGMQLYNTFTPDLAGNNFHWSMLVFVCAITVLAFFSSFRLYQRSFYLKHFEPVVDTSASPSGLGGWLVLWAIILVISLPVILYQFSDYSTMFRLDSWNLLTDVSSDSFKPFWAPILYTELILHIANFVLICTAIIAFFSKKIFVPRLMIIILLYEILFQITDITFLFAFDLFDSGPDVKSFSSLVDSIVNAAIWIPYFIKSKRVRNTFVVP